MQLSRLEIKGFKSFGEKVIIHFDQGITGIVGPNGCGKSNVVDAVRWVLGEQRTKNLRSEKMENVIFNGTKHRRSLQMAEVALTFENNKKLLPTEYSQVTIARRYYRTGDSEYLLNNVVCRLKDIHSLFMDTGIGSDSYAIIELKMVDEILNDTNHSRRGLFEKAAGISRFKTRKKETLKKLEDTDKNLHRIDDLLFEINKNLKSLEKQAKQAEKYHKIKADYKQISLELAHKSVSRQTKRLATLNEKIKHETERKNELEHAIETKDCQLKEKKIALEQIEQQLRSRQETLHQQKIKITAFENEQKLKSEQQRHLKEKKSSIEHQLSSYQDTITSSESELEHLSVQLRSVEKILSEALYHFHEEKEKLAQQEQISTDIKQKYYSIQEQLKAQKNKAATYKKEIQSAQIQYSSKKQEAERLLSENQSRQDDIVKFTNKLAQLRVSLADQEAEAEALRVAEKKLQESILIRKANIEQFQESKIKTNRSIDAFQNEHKLLKSVIDNLEGFPDSVKFLKKHKHWSENIPLVSDIITCEEKYRSALENVLGKHLNYYIVPTEGKALEALAILDHHQRGKVGFFIMENIPETFPKPIKKIKNIIQMLEVVTFDKAYKNLIVHLLNHTLILKNTASKNLLEIIKNNINYQDDIVWVSEKGNIVRGNIKIFGGSVGAFEGKKIGRMSRLKSLTSKLNQLHENISVIDKKIVNHTAEIHTLESQTYQKEIQASASFIVELKQEIVSIRSKKEQLHEIVQKQDNQKQETEEKLYQLNEILHEKSPILAELEEQIRQLEAKAMYLADELKKAEQEKASTNKMYNEQNILMLQKQNMADGLHKENDYKKKNLEKIKNQILTLESDLQQVKNQLKETIYNHESTDELLYKMKVEEKQIQEGTQEAEKSFYKLREDVTNIEEAIRDAREYRENTAHVLQEMQNQANELRIKMLSIQERVAVEFEINLNDILQNKTMKIVSELSESELESKVRHLKTHLHKFGQVNLTAPENYKAIRERYDFIDHQKQDLVNAKDLLLQTIKETDKTAKEHFMNAFDQIRANFITVFRSLFSEEDSCDLTLSDTKNPLESKLEIIAQPKGKKPLTINQLSGGEKTLTAISLLFAIYLLRPAPFCIFDEVDAPLDDANIDKFNKIIKKFSSDSQFIIVTHNKRTMAQADIIYGITMSANDYGVSRILPVDLRDLQEIQTQ